MMGMLANTGMFAQDQFAPETEETRYIYAELVGRQKLFTTKMAVSIDYGQHSKWYSDNRIRDRHGKVVAFNSMIDALNVMGSQGWQFVQAYVAPEDNVNVYHWVLKRALVKDENGNYYIPDIKRTQKDKK